MKHPASSSRVLSTAFVFAALLLPAAPAFAGWASDRVDTKREVYAIADADRDGNIDPAERDRLRQLFAMRTDFEVIDLNGNRRLEREEIDALELEQKAADKRKRDELKQKEDKEKEEKKKKKKKKKN